MRVRATTPLAVLASLATASIALAACSSAPADPGAGGGTSGGETAAAPTVVNVVTHDSVEIGEDLLAKFTDATGYTVAFSAPGDAGSLVSQLILTKDSPLGDVVYGIDNTFAARAVSNGVIADYSAPVLPTTADDYLVGDSGLVPIDMGDVCLNVDHEWFAANNVTEPVTFDDLLKPEYQDLLVLTNPAQSSPGAAFMLATISVFGDGWTDYWTGLLDNGATIVDSWSDAYYTDFTGAGGARPIALSYSTSPAFTVAEGSEESTTGALLDTCFRQVEYAGVLTGAANPDGAQEFINFLLSDEVQASIPDAMYMYPIAPVDLPAEWVAHAPLSPNPHTVDPSEIEANLDVWLRAYHDDVIG